MAKYIICLGDGMADHPISALAGKTPLEVAQTPGIDYISEHGILGMVDTVPEGFQPGSDVANMGILGIDPATCYSGRGPIEAASMGVECADDEVIFRCNLVCVEQGQMQDFTAGHIETEQSTQLMQDLNTAFEGSDIRFVAGVSYRHIMIAPKKFADLTTVAPHDITDKPIKSFLPTGVYENDFLEIISKANAVLEQSEVNKQRKASRLKQATSIWPWSQGLYPKMPSFKSRYGLSGGVVTAVDLLKGLGFLMDLATPHVEGATGFIDTNYQAKVAAAKDILKEHDFCYLHIEAPDEAGHMGDVDIKIKAIEDFDKHVVIPMLDYQKQTNDCKIMVLPDHPTPCALKTHTHEPVPFCVYSNSKQEQFGSKLGYSEKNGVSTGVHFNTPWDLLVNFLDQ